MVLIRSRVFAVLFALTAPCLAQDFGSPVREGPSVIDPRQAGVGRLAPDVSLAGVGGKAVRLSDLRGRPVVVCVSGRDCPVSRRYGPVLDALGQDYRARGVEFVRVSADDPGVPALGARSSTEAFVLDAARTLVYRGAVDDQFGLGYSLPKARRPFLRDAIDAVLSGTRPPVEATTAPGCELPPAAAAPAAAAADVTWHNRISRIVQRNCLECHREGENGPFVLATYDQVKEHAATIKRVVRRGTMPPWFADPKVGHWSNDRSLSEADRADVLTWIEAGAPVGDERDAPVAPTFVSGWKIGKPDAVFETPYAFQVPATGAMDYQRVMVQTHLPEDRWVTSVEVRPSSPAVVHHVLVFLVYPPDHARLGDQPRYKDGLDGYFAGLVPGQGHVVYPRGVAKFIPKDAVLVFQIHYTPNGTATEDRPKIGMTFSDGPPEHELSTRGVFNTRFQIPPGADNFAVTASHLFRFPVRLLAFNPHSHVRGKAYRYEMVYPDGRAETVLDLPRYDFNWQTEYLLREPLDVPAGTRLKVTAWYDNSEKNPANPDPAATVRFGDQTWDEMMIGYFSGYRLPDAPKAEGAAAAVP
jgi:mono/diheme cytochrome c family protein